MCHPIIEMKAQRTSDDEREILRSGSNLSKVRAAFLAKGRAGQMLLEMWLDIVGDLWTRPRL